MAVGGLLSVVGFDSSLSVLEEQPGSDGKSILLSSSLSMRSLHSGADAPANCISMLSRGRAPTFPRTICSTFSAGSVFIGAVSYGDDFVLRALMLVPFLWIFPET